MKPLNILTLVLSLLALLITAYFTGRTHGMLDAHRIHESVHHSAGGL
jgi:hypothetical protein